MLIAQFLFNKNFEENVIFTFLIFVGLYIFLYIIYPPAIRDVALEFYRIDSPLDIMKFSFFEMILNTISRHSYLFALSSILIIYKFLRENKTDLSKPIPSVIFVFFLISFLGFGFTKYTAPRYIIYPHFLIFIIAGKMLSDLSKNRIFLGIFVFLLLVNVYQIIKVFPYFGEYSNFGKQYWLSDHKDYYDHVPALEEAISYLNKLGSPRILTNEHNMLIFYSGISIPLVASYEQQRCNKDYLSSVINATYIVYYGGYGGQKDIAQDPYVCPILRSMPLELVQSFGDFRGGAESLKVKIYKIKG